jgi:hypothetical protein
MSEKKARQELNALVKKEMIALENGVLKNLTAKKKAQAKSFIHSFYEAKFACEGKIKLKSVDFLLKEFS